MQRYGVRDVQKLLRLSRGTIRALVEAGFVSPARGPRRSWQFSFQDLIVLRTAQALSEANVPRRRVTQSVRQLRRHLPDAMPLSGLRISAVGDRVVVKEGDSRWQADSGQYLLAFEGDPAAGSLSVVEPKARAASAEEWFERAVTLEEKDKQSAKRAYEEAIGANAAFSDAYVNLGCLLHEAGDLPGAARTYRSGLKACGGDPALLFNLGVLLEDMGQREEAKQAYEEALQGDPELADCHYNLALLCEATGEPKQAIQHMAKYRRLTARP